MKSKKSWRSKTERRAEPDRGRRTAPEKPSHWTKKFIDETDIVVTPERTEEEDRVGMQEQISTLAYEYYLERGGQNGNALNDWLAAERQILRRSEKSPQRGNR